VFCLDSVQEGFGIVFLEAMAAGKPIVAARAAAVPELVRSGVLVEPENPDALGHDPTPQAYFERGNPF
jgi:glycosyltransferase involved in cell wall biosynthesis